MGRGVPFPVQVTVFEWDDLFEFHQNVANDIGVGVLLDGDSGGRVGNVCHDCSFDESRFAYGSADEVGDFNHLTAFMGADFDFVWHSVDYTRRSAQIKDSRSFLDLYSVIGEYGDAWIRFYGSGISLL